MRGQKVIIIIFMALFALLGAAVVYYFINMPDIPEKEIVFHPIEDIIEGYTPEAAAADGCLVKRGNEIISGKEVWKRFLADSRAGKPAKIRIYNQASSEANGSSYIYSVDDLTYDGTVYELKDYEMQGGQYINRQSSHKYLVQGIYNSPQAYSIGYLLADDPSVTMEGYFMRFASSSFDPENTEWQKYNNCRLLFTLKTRLSELDNESLLEFIDEWKIQIPGGRSAADIRALIILLEGDIDHEIPREWKNEEEFVNNVRTAVASYYNLYGE